MSAALARTQSTDIKSGRRASSTRGPRLEVIDRSELRSQRWRRRVMVGLFFSVLIGLFAIATAHAQLVSNQQDLDDLRQQLAEAEAETARVQRAVDLASSPALIVERAQSLGMVRAVDPVYLAPVGSLQDVGPPIVLLSEDGVIVDANTGNGEGGIDSVAAPKQAKSSVDVASTLAGSRAVVANTGAE